ncbi:hypothetical protein [Cryobacterium sp. Y57]|uniref:hypothetical protein n=1 Tax=Cryobacterium sp. Y57 TaxID=2048287 RepID=UPI000CE5004D|nr:hypothetical protein [Cryobacterium sp. Y57]
MSTRCLHCGQTREGIKRDNTICGIEGGYEYVELQEEWPRHRWADWSDKILTGFGIVPEAFERYRRVPVMDVQWLACDDLKRGHIYPKANDPESGFRTNQCMACGREITANETEQGEEQ